PGARAGAGSSEPARSGATPVSASATPARGAVERTLIRASVRRVRGMDLSPGSRRSRARAARARAPWEAARGILQIPARDVPLQANAPRFAGARDLSSEHRSERGEGARLRRHAPHRRGAVASVHDRDDESWRAARGVVPRLARIVATSRPRRAATL